MANKLTRKMRIALESSLENKKVPDIKRSTLVLMKKFQLSEHSAEKIAAYWIQSRN